MDTPAIPTTEETPSQEIRDEDSVGGNEQAAIGITEQQQPLPSVSTQDTEADGSLSSLPITTSPPRNAEDHDVQQPTSRRVPRILGSCTYCAELWIVIYTRPDGRALTNNKEACKETLHVMCTQCYENHIKQAALQNQPPTCPICRSNIQELFDVTEQMEEAFPPELGKSRKRKRPVKAKPTRVATPGAYTCDCGSSFANRGSLSRHRKRHLDLRPHICELCCKDFVSRDHLNRHKKSIHKIE